MSNDSNDSIRPPPSVVRWWDPLIIGVVIAGVYGGIHSSRISNLELVLALVGAVTSVMFLVEYWHGPARETPRPTLNIKDIFEQVVIKWVGVCAGAYLIIFAWMLLPEYQLKNYLSLFEGVKVALPTLLALVPIYLFYTEWRMGPKRDHTWHFGMMILRPRQGIDWREIRDGLFGWLIKGFFLPLNFCAAVNLVARIRGHETAFLSSPWPQAVVLLSQILTCFMIISIIPGYIFSLRLLGTEIRKVDQTAMGWAVTMFCYPPVNRGTGKGWFAYHFAVASGTTSPWITWTGSYEMLFYVVGTLILLFEFGHYWSEATCCLRSSHLSNRGIITNGAFRLTKHPVYVVKFGAWGLTWLPFLSGRTPWECVQQTILFCAFAGVYVLRAWIEERLLSNDPDYVRYALWMDDHSIFRWVGRWMPIFRYSRRLEYFRLSAAKDTST